MTFLKNTENQKVEVSVKKDIYLAVDSMRIYQPRYTKDKKNIVAIVKGENGQLTEIEERADDFRSSFIRDVFSQYTEEEIELFTARERAVSSEYKKRLQQSTRDKKIEQERERTYQAKIQAFAMDEVKNCADWQIKMKIRKARSPFEVQAWVTQVLLQREKI